MYRTNEPIAHPPSSANDVIIELPTLNTAGESNDTPAANESLDADVLRLRTALGGDPTVSLRFYPRALKFFVSSTFTDTAAERNALIRTVYPKVRAQARARRIAFEAAEMRWGIREEAGDDNLTEAFCLRKLEECRRESGGLFFLSLWADKYGFCPLPRGELTHLKLAAAALPPTSPSRAHAACHACAQSWMPRASTRCLHS